MNVSNVSFNGQIFEDTPDQLKSISSKASSKPKEEKDQFDDVCRAVLKGSRFKANTASRKLFDSCAKKLIIETRFRTNQGSNFCSALPQKQRQQINDYSSFTKKIESTSTPSLTLPLHKNSRFTQSISDQKFNKHNDSRRCGKFTANLTSDPFLPDVSYVLLKNGVSETLPVSKESAERKELDFEKPMVNETWLRISMLAPIAVHESLNVLGELVGDAAKTYCSLNKHTQQVCTGAKQTGRLTLDAIKWITPEPVKDVAIETLTAYASWIERQAVHLERTYNIPPKCTRSYFAGLIDIASFTAVPLMSRAFRRVSPIDENLMSMVERSHDTYMKSLPKIESWKTLVHSGAAVTFYKDSAYIKVLKFDKGSKSHIIKLTDANEALQELFGSRFLNSLPLQNLRVTNTRSLYKTSYSDVALLKEYAPGKTLEEIFMTSNVSEIKNSITALSKAYSELQLISRKKAHPASTNRDSLFYSFLETFEEANQNLRSLQLPQIAITDGTVHKLTKEAIRNQKFGEYAIGDNSLANFVYSQNGGLSLFGSIRFFLLGTQIDLANKFFNARYMFVRTEGCTFRKIAYCSYVTKSPVKSINGLIKLLSELFNQPLARWKVHTVF